MWYRAKGQQDGAQVDGLLGDGLARREALAQREQRALARRPQLLLARAHDGRLDVAGCERHRGVLRVVDKVAHTRRALHWRRAAAHVLEHPAVVAREDAVEGCECVERHLHLLVQRQALVKGARRVVDEKLEDEGAPARP